MLKNQRVRTLREAAEDSDPVHARATPTGGSERMQVSYHRASRHLAGRSGRTYRQSYLRLQRKYWKRGGRSLARRPKRSETGEKNV